MTKLADYKQSKLESIADLLAVIEAEETEPIEDLAIAGAAGDPGRERKPWARRLTKRDGTDPIIVPLHQSEWRPARRW